MANKSEPITRADPLFMFNTTGGPGFAQCAPQCRMFIPGNHPDNKTKHDACILHGAKVTVGAGYSCCLFAKWPRGKAEPEVIKNHAIELGTDLPGSVTPEESGLVERQVRCENCRYFDEDESDCELYERLNQIKSPEFPFQLDTKVKPDACCNFNTEGPKVSDRGESEMQEHLAQVKADRKRRGR